MEIDSVSVDERIHKTKQDKKTWEILQIKTEEKKKWEIQQEFMLGMMEQAFHWKQSAEEYDALVRDYYIQRQKHQKRVMRLNQILYGPRVGGCEHSLGPTLEDPYVGTAYGTGQGSDDRMAMHEHQQQHGHYEHQQQHGHYEHQQLCNQPFHGVEERQQLNARSPLHNWNMSIHDKNDVGMNQQSLKRERVDEQGFSAAKKQQRNS